MGGLKNLSKEIDRSKISSLHEEAEKMQRKMDELMDANQKQLDLLQQHEGKLENIAKDFYDNINVANEFFVELQTAEKECLENFNEATSDTNTQFDKAIDDFKKAIESRKQRISRDLLKKHVEMEKKLDEIRGNVENATFDISQ